MSTGIEVPLILAAGPIDANAELPTFVTTPAENITERHGYLHYRLVGNYVQEYSLANRSTDMYLHLAKCRTMILQISGNTFKFQV